MIKFQYKRAENGDFKCPHCDFTKANQSTVHMHIRAKHSGDFKHKCESCNFETAIKQNLDNHIKAKHPENNNPVVKDFKCPGCDFESLTKGGLRSHYLLQHLSSHVIKFQGKNTNGIVCTNCGDEFKSKPSFVYHLVNCLPEDVKADANVKKGLGLPA